MCPVAQSERHDDPWLIGEPVPNVAAMVEEIVVGGGVRPCGWTTSGGDFDHLAGVLILEGDGAQVAQD